MELFLVLSDKFNLKLQVKKFHIFLLEVHWYGRKFSCSGYKMDPHNVQALRDML